MKRGKILKQITNILIISFALLITLSTYNINNKKLESNYNDFSYLNNISNNKEENYIENLRKKYNNDDVIANISIENTKLDVPVVQGEDNSYYLTHNIYRKNSYEAIFMDYRNDLDKSKKILIYGHNSTKADRPFGQLEKYYDSNYYNNHKIIKLLTEKELREYEIFSVYIETNDWTYMNLKINDKDWYNHLLKLKNKSMYDTDVDIEENDDILILQTCSNHKDYKNYSRKYLLVISKRIK